MYYQNYEDYMRSVLGYPIEPRNTYEMYNFMPYGNTTNNYSDEIVDLYPEIYKLVNPMVCKICASNTKPITRELIEQMTEEIYTNIETAPEIDTVINVQVNTPRENRETSAKDTSLSSTSSKNVRSNNSTTKSDMKVSKDIPEKRETRQFGRNRSLQDLIRILILNQLLGAGRPPHHRPPFPPRPPVRPPRPREDRYYNEYYFEKF